MATTNFAAGTVVASTWLNDVDEHVYEKHHIVDVKEYGAVGDGTTNDTAAVQAAIAAVRRNGVSILDTIGGNTITVYTSAIVYFPSGVYKVDADTLLISQDLGLTFKGAGSRRTNNAVYGATTILCNDASSGYVIKVYRTGGRGFTIEDMDICYNNSSFTGSVIDIVDCPGFTMNRAFVGNYGITAPTRLQTAAACLRTTYDEFMSFTNCAFDGAEIGWWSDDTRTELANTFGGSVTKFDSCVFYDFADNQVYHAGNRTREAVTFTNCVFNPIQVSPSSSGINMDNVDGLIITGCLFQPSTTAAPTSQWCRATNITGQICGNIFGDLTASAVLSGQLELSNNKFAGTAGPTIQGGSVSGDGNEFSTGTGWLFSPTYGLSFDVGPDVFKSPVTRSYDIPSDSSDLSGHIRYDRSNDSSVNKFRNTSARVSLRSVDSQAFSVSSATYSPSILDTGRQVIATGGSNQTFTLPVPVAGCSLTITKISAVNLTINCSAGTVFYGVGTTTYGTAALAGTAQGTITLNCYGTAGWIVMNQTTAFTYS